MLLGRYARWSGAGLIATAAALSLTVPAQASPAAGNPPPAGAVLNTPATNTPHFFPGPTNPSPGTPVEQIRELVECKGDMYAVGTFSRIYSGGQAYSMDNIFKFSASAPYTMAVWSPKVHGTINSIAFAGGKCAHAYIGGKFTRIGNTKASHIAEITTTSPPTVVTSFGHASNGQVETIEAYQNHLIVGGYFTAINGASRDPYLTSLNPANGNYDGFIVTSVSGHYSFPGVAQNPTRVFNQALSSGGSMDIVMGDFTSAGHQPRQQMFMLNLASRPHPAVTGWYPWQYNKSCSPVEPFYGQAAAFSPNGKTIFVANTGTKPGQTTGHVHRTGLCDAAGAFANKWIKESTQWINYTGCDSLYSAAADSSAAYFGGHERWSNNPDGCDVQQPPAITAPGMEGLAPSSGLPFTDTTGTAGYYSRDRGQGADDMLITGAGTGNGHGGLWIASDNAFGSQSCGGKPGLAGLCFLPYS